MPAPTSEQVLALPLGKNNADAETVQDYLVTLLRKVWREEEDFNGKRPFGNSGWVYEVYGPMIKAGFVKGVIDEYGYVDECDTRAAGKLIDRAILSLGSEPYSFDPDRDGDQHP